MAAGKSNTAQQPNIEYHIFDKPSGFMRGFVTGFMQTRKGRVRIAHAYLRTDRSAEIGTDLSKKFGVDELASAVRALEQFEKKVRELDNPG